MVLKEPEKLTPLDWGYYDSDKEIDEFIARMRKEGYIKEE